MNGLRLNIFDFRSSEAALQASLTIRPRWHASQVPRKGQHLSSNDECWNEALGVVSGRSKLTIE
jgi:hypothetical protein